MSPRTAEANAKRSAVLARIEHIFVQQKDQMGGACKVPTMGSIVGKQAEGVFIRTIGIARTEVKVGLANLACNIDRLIFHERRAAMG